jgi:tripartite ATP-independent transporter DctM subunit
VSDPTLGLLMLGLIVVAIMMGFPTAFTLMGLGIIFGFVAFFTPGEAWIDNRVFDLMVQRTYGVMTNDTLLSIPLFVLMGYIIERAAMVDKMFYSVQLAFRRVPGSLAIATMIICTFWGIASGIVGAVVALMGLLAMPAMLRAGYDVKLASGVITAGGTLGILIPPSVMLIVYAAVAGISVVKLYAGAMLPGFFLSFIYLVYILVLVLVKPSLAPKVPPREDISGWGILKMLVVSSAPLTFLTVAVLAVIMFGITTATESAGIGALGALVLAMFSFDVSPRLERVKLWVLSISGGASVVALVAYLVLAEEITTRGVILCASPYVVATVLLGLVVVALEPALRQRLRRNLSESVVLTARTTAMVCWLFVGSAIFSAVFALHGGQSLIERWVLGMNLTGWQFMLLSQAIIFLLGWPLEWTEIIVIFVPIFLPMLDHFNIDPIFFGVLVAVNLQAAFLSPPVAMSAFYLKGVAPPHVTLNQIFAGMMPYMLLVILCMVIMYLWPPMTLWLPDYLYSR